jgi:hypothetical protein
MLYNVKLTQFNLKFTQKNLFFTPNVVESAPHDVLRKNLKICVFDVFVRKFSENSDQKLQKTHEKFDLRQIYAEYTLMGLESYRAYYAYHA